MTKHSDLVRRLREYAAARFAEFGDEDADADAMVQAANALAEQPDDEQPARQDGWFVGIGWPPVPTKEDMADITERMAAVGAHVLSEWLDDAAPLHERRYIEPARAAFASMRFVQPAPAPVVVTELQRQHDALVADLEGLIPTWREQATNGRKLSDDEPEPIKQCALYACALLSDYHADELTALIAKHKGSAT